MLHLATPVILTHPQPVVSKENDVKISLNCSAHDYGLGNVQYNGKNTIRLMIVGENFL